VAKDLGEREINQLIDLCLEYEEIWQDDVRKVKPMRMEPYEARFKPDYKPIYRNPRPISLVEKEAAKRLFGKLEEGGLIAKRTGAMGHPVVIVKKPSYRAREGPIQPEDLRATIDYSIGLNKYIEDENFPLPRPDEIQFALAGKRYITTLDCTNGFFQIPIGPKTQAATGFVLSSGRYEWLRLPQGAKVSPAVFCQKVHEIYHDEMAPDGPVLIYVDDLTIASSSWEQHLRDLRMVFERAAAHGLQFALKKAQFVREELKILGSIVRRDGTVVPDPSKTVALAAMPAPRSVHEVRVFLGMVNYYRHFVPNCSEWCIPMQTLLRRNVPFVWSEECQEVFDRLKTALLSPKVLAQPDPDIPFVLATDASDYAIGAVLSQIRDGMEHPIAFYSKTLSEVERRWPAVEKEVYAIVASVQHWRQYLLGRPFSLFTDCQALSWALRLTAPAGKLARWSMLLQEYRYTVHHRPGVRNQNADALSRLPQNSNDEGLEL
jgi:hypothetical protein